MVVADAIEEEGIGDTAEDLELVAIPDDFLACINCKTPLTQDEKIINTRFVNEGMAAERDITMLPLCFKCNYFNLN